MSRGRPAEQGRRDSSPDATALHPACRAVGKFISIGAAILAAGIALKSLDKVLYHLDEKRPQRIAEHQLHLKAVAAQKALLIEQAAAATEA